ncbi:DUF4350 domain-containing protein [Nocardioides marmoraquaticus]
MVGLAVALGAGVLVLVSLGQDGRTDLPLDPRNPGPEGAEAVARVLERQGVGVTVVRDQEALLATGVDGATVVVTDPGSLSPSTTAALEDHASTAEALVVVGDGAALAGSGPGEPLGVQAPSRDAGTVEAGCDLPAAAGLRVALDDGEDIAAEGTTSCFGGALLALDADGVPLRLLAAPEVLANGTVTDADAAALALRLLGATDRLVWYLPDTADSAPDETVGLGSLLPDWLLPALWLLALSALAAVLWRGRRLGPVVVEPLPVVVRAAESTHARGRLYHRAADRGHAARVLREATRARLARRLRLAPDAAPEVVADAVARRTGRDATVVVGLLAADPPPTRDPELADLGRRLTALEDEVHQR